MAAGAIKQGYIKNQLEEVMMGRLGKLTRSDLRGVPLAGSDYPKVYICSPFAAYGQITVQTNIAETKRYCHYAIERKCQPVSSSLIYPQLLDDRNEYEREMGLSFGLSLLAECTQVWVFRRRDGRISTGMATEIDFAKKLRIPVVFINDPKAYGEPGWNPLRTGSGR